MKRFFLFTPKIHHIHKHTQNDSLSIRAKYLIRRTEIKHPATVLCNKIFIPRTTRAHVYCSRRDKEMLDTLNYIFTCQGSNFHQGWFPAGKDRKVTVCAIPEGKLKSGNWTRGNRKHASEEHPSSECSRGQWEIRTIFCVIPSSSSPGRNSPSLRYSVSCRVVKQAGKEVKNTSNPEAGCSCHMAYPWNGVFLGESSYIRYGAYRNGQKQQQQQVVV